MENQTQRPLPNATAVLVLGIVSIVGCFCYGIAGIVCGIIAVVLSGKDLRLYNADPTLYTPNSLSNLKSGRICAIIGLSLSAAYLIFLIIYITTVGWAFLSHPWMWQHSSM
jgi:hypothetical protein